METVRVLDSPINVVSRALSFDCEQMFLCQYFAKVSDRMMASMWREKYWNGPFVRLRKITLEWIFSKHKTPPNYHLGSRCLSVILYEDMSLGPVIDSNCFNIAPVKMNIRPQLSGSSLDSHLYGGMSGFGGVGCLTHSLSSPM